MGRNLCLDNFQELRLIELYNETSAYEVSADAVINFLSLFIATYFIICVVFNLKIRKLIFYIERLKIHKKLPFLWT